jgi:carbon-monoxide dehydrogenase medium subunit
MTTFAYHRPDSLAAASELLGREGAIALAGGTDLLVAMRHAKIRPSLMVDLKSVMDLRDEITNYGSHTLEIGGRVVMRQVIDDSSVSRHFPALMKAASVVGSVQIRNRATLAGNLCNASPAADTAPALIAYSATVCVTGPGGARTVPVEDFFVGPGSTVLAEDEIVTSVRIPIPATPVGSAFARVTRRRGVDLASVNLACVVDPSGKVRFGLGAVGPKPLVAGATVDDLSSEDGWSAVMSSTSPITDVRAGAEYRRAMLRVHAERALRAALDELRAVS